jgi:hypothetical protein
MQPQKTARENEPPRGNGNVAVLPDDELDAVTGGLGKILGGKGKIIDGQSSISASLVLAPKSGPRGRRDRPPASSMRRCLRQVKSCMSATASGCRGRTAGIWADGWETGLGYRVATF